MKARKAMEPQLANKDTVAVSQPYTVWKIHCDTIQIIPDHTPMLINGHPKDAPMLIIVILQKLIFLKGTHLYRVDNWSPGVPNAALVEREEWEKSKDIPEVSCF